MKKFILTLIVSVLFLSNPVKAAISGVNTECGVGYIKSVVLNIMYNSQTRFIIELDTTGVPQPPNTYKNSSLTVVRRGLANDANADANWDALRAIVTNAMINRMPVRLGTMGSICRGASDEVFIRICSSESDCLNDVPL